MEISDQRMNELRDDPLGFHSEEVIALIDMLRAARARLARVEDMTGVVEKLKGERDELADLLDRARIILDVVPPPLSDCYTNLLQPDIYAALARATPGAAADARGEGESDGNR